ncbi:hypothetical protein QWZ08_13515 [Ferruginibacter paludis]|uniref:hypothetical protein n=1 Tax=Ferruginibacter paludis TaxID=1310417 RepID=UPI0025B4058E|nr:hypothetical protein [Ferruginibacter paludis]MDN3656657.1 hypothetical protein [Ferruginibacter paludis]
MKKYAVFILYLLPVIFSCHSKESEKNQPVADTISTVVTTDTANIYKDTHYFWFADFSGKKGFTMVRNRPIPADSLTAEHIIQSFNEIYPEMKLSLNKVSNDSIFIKVGNANYLTSQTGSSGAEAYMAEVTYNLTELKGINFVHFSFQKGEHASPGTYSRTDFIHE